MNEPSDAGLVVAHQSGCPEAFTELYLRHYARLVRFCRGRVGDTATAEDIVQEAFEQALASIDRLQGERRFYPWVRVIAWRLVIEHYRRARLARTAVLRDAGEPVTVAESPEQLLVRGAARAQVQQALERVPERHRQVLLLREFDGLSYAEIAERLGVSSSAIPALLHRARNALAREYLALTWAERINSLASWAGALLVGCRRRIGRWSAYLPDANALSVPGVTAVLAAGSVLGTLASLGGVPSHDRHQNIALARPGGIGFQDVHAPATASTVPSDEGPTTGPSAARPPVRVPSNGSMIIGPRVKNAGGFEKGVASVSHGERGRTDRERARQMPYYMEVGPVFWSADPGQAMRDIHAIAEGIRHSGGPFPDESGGIVRSDP